MCDRIHQHGADGAGGLKFTPEGVTVKPYLPEEIAEFHLENMPYRDAVLGIHVTKGGGGDRSRERDAIFVPATRRGRVELEFQAG